MKNQFIEEYLKHTALNLGQAARDIRYIYYHPSADEIAVEGSWKHVARSLRLRVKNLGKNIFYSLMPPHWHHSREELRQMQVGTAKAWFLFGYAPWVYVDPAATKVDPAP